MELLILALMAVESGGKDGEIGDKHLAQKAYGCLQIRQPVCNDYNKAHGTKHQAKDCLGNRELSVRICTWYLEYYGKGKTLEAKARIWNGGPKGDQKKATVGYWRKVNKILKDLKPKAKKKKK